MSSESSMLSYSDALRRVRQVAARFEMSCETVPLARASGRVLAETVIASEDNPRFAASAMDGYAIRSEETKSCENMPLRLRIRGSVPAGTRWTKGELSQGCCVEIMTGAPIPEDVFDAVVRMEDVRKEGDEIVVSKFVASGENLRRAGDDFRSGDKLIAAGTRIEPQHILALATIGKTALEVRRAIRIAVLSSGDELVPIESRTLNDAQIRNSSSALLLAAFQQYGTEVYYFGTASDSKREIELLLSNVRECAPDILITTGGVSVGAHDHVKSVLTEESSKLYFHKVAMRPGKPIIFGELRDSRTVFFGLPGNPISTVVGLRFFVVPYMRALCGEPVEEGEILPLEEATTQPSGLTYFQRGVRCASGVKALSKQGSFVVSSLLKAQGWIVSDKDEARIKSGESVRWFELW